MIQITARTPIKSSLLALFGFLILPACAGQVPPISPRYEWIDLYACKKPHPAPPPLPNNDLVYNVERRFIDLDQNGQCVVMDVWLERLSSIPDSVSRTFEQRWRRFEAGRWQSFSAYPLEYFPYALRLTSGKVIFIQAAINADVGDSLVLRERDISIMILEFNSPEARAASKRLFQKYTGDEKRELLTALAAGLNSRLQSGALIHEELTNVSLEMRPQIETERIAQILKAATGFPSAGPKR